MAATLTYAAAMGEHPMKKKNVKVPRKSPDGSKDEYWRKSDRYPGVTHRGGGETGTTKGAHISPRRNAKGKRGHQGRKYTATEKMLLKGLTGSRES